LKIFPASSVILYTSRIPEVHILTLARHACGWYYEQRNQTLRYADKAGRIMIRIGTSGWTYDSWKGRFYPEDLPRKKWLEYFSGEFAIVELNASFYHVPKKSVCEGWRSRTRDEFLFAVKLPRIISHFRKLRNCGDVLGWFFDALSPLVAKIPVYLVQLPPGFLPESETLDSFIGLLPGGRRYAFELRSASPIPQSILGVLRKRNAAACIHDLPGYKSDEPLTADFVYVRFHGYRSRYGGSYPNEVLASWASRIREWGVRGLDVFAFFNNDTEGNAVANARTLIESVAGL
jgi:uncharacterized protein YecE (DUF72 family)